MATALIIFQTISGSLSSSWAEGCLADIYCVTSTQDDGVGTLRQKVLEANAATGESFIGFADELFGENVVRDGEVLRTSDNSLLDTVTITLESTLAIRNGVTIMAPTNADREILVTIERGSGVGQDSPLIAINPVPIFETETASSGEASETVTIKNIHINSNSNISYSTDAGEIPWPTGIAIQVDSTTVVLGSGEENVTPDLVLVNVVIENSVSESNGAAINSSGNVIVRDSTLSGNFSDGSGGAIFAEGDVTIESSTVISNFAFQDGGAVSGNGNITIVNSVFTENMSGGSGGAVYSEASIMVRDSSFGANSALFDGGALYASETVTALNSHFDSTPVFNPNFFQPEFISNHLYDPDERIVNPACIGILQVITDTPDGPLWGCNPQNVYDDLDNILYTTWELSTIINEDFDPRPMIPNPDFVPDPDEFILRGNSSEGDGGAISANSVSISQSSFVENTSGGHGGGVFISGDMTLSTIHKSSFESNSSDIAGGALACTVSFEFDLSGCGINVTDSTFTNNDAVGLGGAIFAPGILQVSDSEFFGNGTFNGMDPSAFVGGGAITANRINVARSTFIDNWSSGDGGAIQILSNFEFDPLFEPSLIIASDFENNTSEGGSGGAVSGPAVAFLSTFIDNSASIAGEAINSENWFGFGPESFFFMWGNLLQGDPENDLCGAPVQEFFNNISSDESCFSENEESNLGSILSSGETELDSLAAEFIPFSTWQGWTSLFEQAQDETPTAILEFLLANLNLDINGDVRPTMANWSAGALQRASLPVVFPAVTYGQRVERDIEAEKFSKERSDALRKAFLAKRAAFLKARAENRLRSDAIRLKISYWKLKRT